jgi:hypothetical protein
VLNHLVDLADLSLAFLTSLAMTQGLVLLVRAWADYIVTLHSSHVESLLFEKKLVGKQCPFDLLYITTPKIAIMGLYG